MPEPEQLHTMWILKVVLGDKRVVFQRREGNGSYNNMVFWMYENIAEIEAILEHHVNDDPKVIIYDEGFDPD